MHGAHLALSSHEKSTGEWPELRSIKIFRKFSKKSQRLFLAPPVIRKTWFPIETEPMASGERWTDLQYKNSNREGETTAPGELNKFVEQSA